MVRPAKPIKKDKYTHCGLYNSKMEQVPANNFINYDPNGQQNNSTSHPTTGSGTNNSNTTPRASSTLERSRKTARKSNNNGSTIDQYLNTTNTCSSNVGQLIITSNNSINYNNFTYNNTTTIQVNNQFNEFISNINTQLNNHSDSEIFPLQLDIEDVQRSYYIYHQSLHNITSKTTNNHNN